MELRSTAESVSAPRSWSRASLVFWSLLALLLAAVLGVALSWVRQVELARERTALFESLSNIRNLREKTSLGYSRAMIDALTFSSDHIDLAADASAELERLHRDCADDPQLTSACHGFNQALAALNNAINDRAHLGDSDTISSWADSRSELFEQLIKSIEDVRAVQLTRFGEVLRDAQEGAVRIQLAMLAVLVIAVAGLTTGGLLVRRENRRRDRIDALRKASEQKLERAEQIAHIGYWFNDRHSETVSGSTEYFRIMGLPPCDSVPVATIFDRVISSDRDRILQLHQELEESPQDRMIEFRIRLDDGRLRNLIANITTETDPGGKLLRTFGTIQDVTDQRTAEAQAMAWRLRFEAAVKAARLLVYERNPVNQEMRWEGAVLETVGVSPAELADLPAWMARIHPDDLAAFHASLDHASRPATGSACEYRVRHEDGRYVHVLDRSAESLSESGDPVIVGLVLDMSDRKRLEEELLQAQKLESIGRLAGGVAHDLNNWLTAILGFANLARIDHEVSRLLEYLDRIELAGNSAAKMTGQLLAYARRRVIEPRPCSLNDVVRDAAQLLRPLLGENIKVRVVLHPDLWTVRVDPGQFEQVVVNLAVNARDAMPGGGQLTIETSNVHLNEEYRRTHPEVMPGQHVQLAISDTGEGIPASQLSRIFDPFYTTKPRGAGTGLGLATVLGLVKQHHGHIWVYSEIGKGTTFKIYVPREVAPRQAAETAAPADACGSGTETVLVVEDEALVRELAVASLRSRGYHVLEACTAEEAVEIIRSFDGRIDIMVTDVIMPGMSGKQIAERLVAARPGTRILYTSGYTDNVVVHHGILDRGVQFLQKPYTPVSLAAKVRAVLDSVPATGS